MHQSKLIKVVGWYLYPSQECVKKTVVFYIRSYYSMTIV